MIEWKNNFQILERSVTLGCGRSVTTAEDIWGRCPIQMLPENMSHTLLDEVWLEHVRKVRRIQTLEKYEKPIV